MELLEFLRAVSILRTMYGWRLGQAIFNHALKVNPADALALVYSDVDPFHDDKKSWVFLKRFGVAK